MYPPAAAAASSAAWERGSGANGKPRAAKRGCCESYPANTTACPRARSACAMPTAGGWFPPPSKVTNKKRATAYASGAAGRGAPARASPSSSATACASSGRAAISSRRRCAAVR